MSLETAIYVSAFALLGASLLLLDRMSPWRLAAQERRESAELDALFRPVLLFTLQAPVAHC